MLLYVGVVCGQEKPALSDGEIITFLAPVIHEKTDKNKTLIVDRSNFNVNYIEVGTTFKIIGKEGNKYLISAWPLYKKFDCKKNNEGECIKNENDKSLYYNDKIFKVSEEEMKLKATIPIESDKVSIGLLTLPFKFRYLTDKSFETNFNLNSTINFELIKFWNAGCHVQLGAGIGNTNLSHSNAGGIDVNKDINAATLSLLSGVMLQYKKVQAGFYIGWDHINNQNQYKWIYNGKPWFAFGVGYELFKISLGEKQKNKQP